MRYEVEEGNLVLENGEWLTDSMASSDVHGFELEEDAIAFYDGCDPKGDFEREWSCSTVKPIHKGKYAILYRVDGDEYEVLREKRYSADDHYERL